MPMFANRRGYLPSGSRKLNSLTATRPSKTRASRAPSSVTTPWRSCRPGMSPSSVPWNSGQPKARESRPTLIGLIAASKRTYISSVPACRTRSVSIARAPSNTGRVAGPSRRKCRPVVANGRSAGAELEAPEPPGVPREPRLEQRIVDRAGERGSRGVVVPAQRAAKSLEGEGGGLTAERDAVELEYRARRQPAAISTSPRTVPPPATSRNAVSTRNGWA